MAFYLLDKRNVESDEKRPLVIWNKKNDITFQDLDEDSFDEALEFIENEYLPNHILWKHIINNPTDKAEYLKLITFLMNGKCSLVALNNLNEIIGLVIMFPMRRDISSFQFISMKAGNCPCLKSYMDLTLNFVAILYGNKNYDSSCVMHIFLASIRHDHKFKWFKEELILEGYKIARSMSIPTLSAICESLNDQERVKRVGMQCVGSIPYDDFIANASDSTLFRHLGKGQHSATINVLKVGQKKHMCYLD